MKKHFTVGIFAIGIISLQAQGLLNLTAIQKVTVHGDGSLAPVGTFADFLVGPEADSLVILVEGAVSPGQGSWIVGQTEIAGVPQGATAFVQMRAYSGPAGTTYAEAAIAGNGLLSGESTIQESSPLGGGIGTGPIAIIHEFEIRDIPEPSTIAFAIFAVVPLIIRNWK